MPDDRDIAAIAGPERPRLPDHAVWLVLAAGLLAAIILPDHRLGISFPIAATAVAVAIVATKAREMTRHEIAFGSLGFALAWTPALRAAEWVLALDLLGGVGLACFAVTSAETWRATFLAPFRVLDALLWVPANLVRPVTDRLRGIDTAGLGTFVRTAGITLALVFVFGMLFMSADAAFAQLANDVLLPDLRIDTAVARVVTFSIVALFTGALALAKPTVQIVSGEVATAASTRKVIEWVLPIVVLNVLFASFVAVQMTVLFGGRHHVELTPGLTYAQYARQGFFQLLAVAALVLVVVAATIWVARPGDRRTRRIAQVVLGTLCGLTLVVLASAWYRLDLYEDVFGLTRLRVSVYASIIWLAAIFALLIAAGAVWKSAWLPRAAIAITAVGLLAFTIANPDALIAERNVARYEATEDIDLSYVGTLSEDAVPALTELPEELRDCVLAEIALRRETRDDLSWTEWSYSRTQARATLERLDIPTTPHPSCFAY